MISLQDIQQGYERWAEKPHNSKWVRRIDGTPIANDIVVNIFEALRDIIIVSPGEQRMTTHAQIIAFLAAIRPGCYIQDAGNGEYIIDGVINVGAALSAALAVSSPDVETIKFNGKIIVTHPDMPPHYWDGEKMQPIKIEASL